MTPTPTMGGLPPVMDTIFKKRYRKVSIGGPSYVIEERKKSASLSSLIADEENNVMFIKKGKSKSVLHLMKRWREDDQLIRHQQYRHSEHSRRTKNYSSSVFDYERVLREERKEFEFRLKNIPKASGHLDDFLIIKELASGQFGRVYLAEDVIDKERFAVKTISKDVILRDNLFADVKAERDYLYATNSPFIVSLIQHFEDTQRFYLVEEYVSNGDIYEHLKQHGPFSEELTRFYVSQVVLALEYLHNVNLIYRDLKPENVMIDSTGYIKLVDFGFVKRVNRKTSTFVGTPAYLAPEMILHKSYDKTIDWWSLGILTYEMLSGCQVTPFADSNRMAMYAKITSNKEITFHNNRFPRSVVRDLIKRLLKINPAIRLGNGGNGSQDIKNHPWFAPMKWVQLYRRSLTPPVKRATNLRDSSNDSANITNQQQSPLKFQKVAALKQSLLRMRTAAAADKPQTDTIQNRRRLEKLMKIR